MYDFSVKYDVAVVGAGIAGVAAAVRAARSGAKTVLIEKTVLPGGLATNGLINVFLPLCDGNGRQVTFGLCEELIRRSVVYGPGEIPATWNQGSDNPEVKRFRCVFSPAAYMLALDEMLDEAGVDFWLDTLVCDVEKNSDGDIEALVVENESGRGRIAARQFVDSSGSCMVFRRAGAPCHTDNNSPALWALEFFAGRNGGLGDNVKMGCFCPFIEDWSKLPEDQVFRGISGKSVSAFVLQSRRVLRELYTREYAEGKSDRFSRYALKLPAMPQFRKIFALDARYVLDSNENNRHFEDTVGMVGDWRKAGPVWEIPYRTLLAPAGPRNVLAAGRNIGARNDAWEITRVIPTAALTGDVAGLAAAMAVRRNGQPGDLPVPELQKNLRELGFKLELAEIGLPVSR